MGKSPFKIGKLLILKWNWYKLLKNLTMIKQLFLSTRFILTLIVLNALVIFISGFEWSENTRLQLSLLDHAFTILFVVELAVKMKAFGFKGYWASAWNKLDLILVALSIPALIAFAFDVSARDLSFLLVFRITRIFKSFRFLKFIPGISDLLRGIQRAVKASVIVLIGFTVYIFIVGMLSFYIFHNFSAVYFQDPFESLYSIFKIFTGEGWFEIPEHVARDMTDTQSFFTHLYFIFVLLTGGIFGLSLVNSIFVDAMVSDNTDDIEEKIDALDKKVQQLIDRS